MLQPFIVLRSKEKETAKGVFTTKMQRVTNVETMFGNKEKKETLYVKGDKQITVGSEIPAEYIAETFRIEEYLSDRPNDDGSVTKMMLKWLHLK